MVESEVHNDIGHEEEEEENGGGAVRLQAGAVYRLERALDGAAERRLHEGPVEARLVALARVSLRRDRRHELGERPALLLEDEGEADVNVGVTEPRDGRSGVDIGRQDRRLGRSARQEHQPGKAPSAQRWGQELTRKQEAVPLRMGHGTRSIETLSGSPGRAQSPADCHAGREGSMTSAAF
jgi:hypothetical protein